MLVGTYDTVLIVPAFTGRRKMPSTVPNITYLCGLSIVSRKFFYFFRNFGIYSNLTAISGFFLRIPRAASVILKILRMFAPEAGTSAISLTPALAFCLGAVI